MTQNGPPKWKQNWFQNVQRHAKKRCQKRFRKKNAQISKNRSKMDPKIRPRESQEEPLGEHLGPQGLPKRLPEGSLAPSTAPRIRKRPPAVAQEPPQDARRPNFHDFSQFSALFSPPSSYERTLHNAPIFRLLLKVAVEGAHQCDVLIFYGALQNNRPLHTNAAAVGRSHCNPPRRCGAAWACRVSKTLCQRN